MLQFIHAGVACRRSVLMAAVVILGAQNAPTWAQGPQGYVGCGCSAPCGCATQPGQPSDFYGYDREFAPGDGIPFADEQGAAAPPADGQPSMPNLELSQQYGGGGQFFVTNFAPPSIGDSFSPSWKVMFDDSGEFYTEMPINADVICVPPPSGAAVLGRMKIADNHSPLPRNRIFFDYNYFHNAALIPGGLELHRFSPGFESTFLDGMMSFEMRVPMAVTANSDLTTDFDGSYVGNTENAEFGNLQFVWKTLLVEGPEGAIAAGLSVTAPTADDVNVSLIDGTQLIRVENEAVHLMPYIAALRRFGPNVFVQSFLQVDVDANGNPVLLNTSGDALTPLGRFEDQTFLYADVSLGAWIYRNPGAPVVNGIALVTEAHYTTTVDDMASVSSDGITVGDPNQDLDMLNLTFGAHFAMGQNLVTAGYGVPVSDDRVFDGELRLFINRYY